MIAIVLDQADQVCVPLSYAIPVELLGASAVGDLAVCVKFPEAYRAESEWLFVRFSDEVGAIHQALEVGAVGHPQHMTNLVARSLKTAVEQDLLGGVHYHDADLPVAIQLLHGRLLACCTVIFGVAHEILLARVASEVHLLSWVLPQLVR